jgi:hypothetical protein
VALPVGFNLLFIIFRFQVEFVEGWSKRRSSERREDLASQLGDDLLWHVRAWAGADGQFVGSREWAEWGAINVHAGSSVPVSVNLELETKNFLAKFLNLSDEGEVVVDVVLSGPFFTMDGLLFGLFPGSEEFGPDSGEGNWAGFKGEPVDRFAWGHPGELEGRLSSSEVNFNFSVDGSVDLGDGQDFQTAVDNWRPDLNAGDDGRDDAGVNFVQLDLDGFQGFFRFKLSADSTSHLHDSWDLEGGDQGHTKSGGDLVGHLVKDGSLVELEVVARFKELLDFSDVDVSFIVDHVAQGFADGLKVERQHAEFLILVFQVDVSFRAVGEGSLNGLQFLPQVLQLVEWAVGGGASRRSDQDVFKVHLTPETLVSKILVEKAVDVLDGQTNGEQVLVPETKEVSMEVNGEHLGEGGVVGHNRAEVNVHSQVVFVAVERSSDELAVARIESVGDLLAMSKRQLEVSGELLDTRIGGVGNGVHVGVDEGGHLLASFNEESSGHLVQNWALRKSLEDLVGASNSELSGLVLGHEDGHADLLDFSWEDFSDLAESQDSLNSDLSRVLLDVLDDFLQLEHAEVQTHVADGLHEEDLVLESFRASELLEHLLNEFFLESSRAEFVRSNFELQGELVLVGHAEGIDHGAHGEVDGLLEEPVSLADLRIGQFQHFSDHFLADDANVDEALDGDDSSNWVNLSLADLLNEVEDGVLGASISQSINQDGLDFLVFLRGEALRVGLEEGVVDSFQFRSGQHTEDLDQSNVLARSLLLDRFAHLRDEASENVGNEFDFVLQLRVGGLLEEFLLAFHEELFFGDVPVWGVDHVGVRWLGVSGLLGSGPDGSRGHHNQGLVDIGGDDVALSVEGDQDVLALNDSGLNKEFVPGTTDVVLGNSAAPQEFLVFTVFLFAGWAWVGEAEVVLDLGSLLAFLEVDGLGHVEDWARRVSERSGVSVSQVGWLAGHGVQSLALAFQGVLHDGVEVVFRGLGLLDLVEEDGLFAEVGGSMAVEVDLKHVQDTSLDVGGPGFLSTVENDVADHALAVGELDRELDFLKKLSIDRGLLEGHEWNDGSRVGNVLVHSTNSAPLDREQAGLFRLEDQGNHSLDSGGGVLLAGARNTRG